MSKYHYRREIVDSRHWTPILARSNRVHHRESLTGWIWGPGMCVSARNLVKQEAYLEQRGFPWNPTRPCPCSQQREAHLSVLWSTILSMPCRDTAWLSYCIEIRIKTEFATICLEERYNHVTKAIIKDVHWDLPSCIWRWVAIGYNLDLRIYQINNSKKVSSLSDNRWINTPSIKISKKLINLSFYRRTGDIRCSFWARYESFDYIYTGFVNS